MNNITHFFRMLYYILYDVTIGTIQRDKRYWISESRPFGSWSDYWFISSDELTDKEENSRKVLKSRDSKYYRHSD